PIVALPPGGPDRPPVEVILAVDPVAFLARGVGEDRLDLPSERRRHALVGVQNQRPSVGELRQGPILLRGRALVGMIQHAVRDRVRDRQRPVGAPRIHNHDFLGPANRLETRSDRALFVPGRHEHAQRLAGAPAATAHATLPTRSRSLARHASITIAAVTSFMQRMYLSPGKGQTVWLQWRHSRAAASIAACGPAGGCHAPGCVGPKTVTVGTPSATARCLGPESLLTR